MCSSCLYKLLETTSTSESYINTTEYCCCCTTHQFTEFKINDVIEYIKIEMIDESTSEETPVKGIIREVLNEMGNYKIEIINTNIISENNNDLIIINNKTNCIQLLNTTLNLPKYYSCNNDTCLYKHKKICHICFNKIVMTKPTMTNTKVPKKIMKNF